MRPGRRTQPLQKGPGWCSTLLLLSSNSQPLDKGPRCLAPPSLPSHRGFLRVSHLPLPSFSKDACNASRAHMVTRVTFCLKTLHISMPAKLSATRGHSPRPHGPEPQYPRATTQPLTAALSVSPRRGPPCAGAVVAYGRSLQPGELCPVGAEDPPGGPGSQARPSVGCFKGPGRDGGPILSSVRCWGWGTGVLGCGGEAFGLWR